MRLTDEQVQQFEREGVVIAEGVITEDDLAPVISALSEWIDRRAHELQAAGKIEDLHEDLSFERRFGELYRQSPEIGQGMDIMQSRLPAMHDFLFNDNLLDAVESIIGPEITCSPIQHVRAKPPGAYTSNEPNYFHNTPWHQDAGVTLEEADASQIITVWLPLVDATAETGCMAVMPGVAQLGHLEHQSEGGTTIRPDLLPDAEPLVAEVHKGGAVMMNKYTPHRSLPNRSNKTRWSIDLRYQVAGTPTGRPFHPDFIVRSKQDPSRVQRDYDWWCDAWIEALDKSRGQKIHRVK